MERGYMVAFCGLDGCGKSRMIRELQGKNFFGKEPCLLRHPPDEWFENPKIIAAYLDGEGEKITDPEEVEFVAKVREEKQSDILKTISEGTNVIFHRYMFSLYAYYAGSRTLEQAWIREKMKRLIVPDKVIYLRLSEKGFYQRNSECFSFQKDPEVIKRMIECYDSLAREYDWSIIDADVDDIPGKIQKCESIIAQIDLSKKLVTFEDYEKQYVV